jgi:hypothetical protein
VSITDSAIYRYVNTSFNGQNWVQRSFATGTPSTCTTHPDDTGGTWLTGACTLTVPVAAANFSFAVPGTNKTRNYITAYSCTENVLDLGIVRFRLGWDCHGNATMPGMWQIWNFSAGLEPASCTPSCLNKDCGDDGCSGSCGTCATGTCNSTGQCVTACIPSCAGKSCGDDGCAGSCGSCSSGDYCSAEAGTCLLQVSGNTYFVSTNGDDSNPGNFTHPWGTWQKAFDTADAGDVVYFRGGVWYPTVYVSHDPTNSEGRGVHGNNGALGSVINFLNYPGEVPILDGRDITSTIDQNLLLLRTSDYIRLGGLTIRNLKEKGYNHYIMAVLVLNCGTVYLDRMASHDNGGHGFGLASYRRLYVTNCDSYNNADANSDEPGNRADGFTIGSGGSAGDTDRILYMSGCRAWNNSDDGIDIGSSCQYHISNCWSFANGRLEYGAGSAFKTGMSLVSDPSQRQIHNCIAAFTTTTMGHSSGFAIENLQSYTIGPVNEFFNNIAYRMDHGFTSDPGNYGAGFDCINGSANVVYRNNIVFESIYGRTGVYPNYYETYLTLCNGASPKNTMDHNNWIHQEGSPYWSFNPSVSVSQADFVSLPTDASDCIDILSAPRKADGSLPDIGGYFHLASGSDLINAGVDVSLPYSGSAPDIGTFEYTG